MDQLQHKNLREIEGLNQRGGRTLSFIDLIRAGTVSAEMVAYCWTAIAHGASFLTAARPGGAGKSTVLANLLALLPPGEEIVTYSDQSVVEPTARKCYLAHEIGAGHWYGYILGGEVKAFLSLADDGHRLAGCIHADTLEELAGIFSSPPLTVSAEQMRCLDLVLFIHVMPGQQRRVVAVHEAVPGGYRLAFSWDDDKSQFVRHGSSALMERLGSGEEEYQRRLEAVRRFLREGEDDLEELRRKALKEYQR